MRDVMIEELADLHHEERVDGAGALFALFGVDSRVAFDDQADGASVGQFTHQRVRAASRSEHACCG